jgi:ACS family glucarate transporter-like MFS transporter
VTGIYASGQVLTFVCLPKIIGQWCGPEEIGLASGLYLSAFSVGSAVALAVTQPFFGDDWRKCFILLSTAGIVVTTMWWSIAAQSPPVNLSASLDQAGFRSFVSLLKIRNLILLTVIYFFYIAAWSGWITFAYPYFVIARHFTPSMAGYVLTVTMLGYILGSILIPYSSDWFGLRRPFSIGGCLILIFGFSLLSFFPEVMGARTLSLALGISFGALVTFIFSIPLELSEIEDKLIGSATGIIASGGSLASLLITPLLGVRIGRLHEARSQDYVSVWITISIVSIILLTCFLLLKETGTKAQATHPGGTVQNKAPGTLADGVSPKSY